jgi:hypothetical protein
LGFGAEENSLETVLHGGGWSAVGVAGEVGLLVVVVVGSQFGKEQNDGRKLIDIDAGQYRGQRCWATVSFLRLWTAAEEGALAGIVAVGSGSKVVLRVEDVEVKLLLGFNDDGRVRWQCSMVNRVAVDKEQSRAEADGRECEGKWRSEGEPLHCVVRTLDKAGVRRLAKAVRRRQFNDQWSGGDGEQGRRGR